MDEAWLGLDLMSRSILDILASRVFTVDLPVVPMGFALMEKAVISALGPSEYALRLFPLMCGLLSLGLFYRVASHYLGRNGCLIALALFAFNSILIRYSAESKQYATELLAVLWLYHVAFDSLGDYKNEEARRRLLYSGILAIFISHMSVLVILAVALIQWVDCFRDKAWDRSRELIVTHLLWLCVLFLFHGYACWFMFNSRVLLQNAKEFFMPYPVWSFPALTWTTRSFDRLFAEVVGIDFFLLGSVLFGWGWFSLFRRHKAQAVLLVAPLALAWAGAVLHKYPFGHRFLIFATVPLIISISRGVIALMEIRTPRQRLKNALAVAVLAALLARPVGAEAYAQVHGYNIPDYREAVGYLKAHWQKGDALFLNHSAQFTYGYYMGNDGHRYRAEPTVMIFDDRYHDKKWPYIRLQNLVYYFNEEGIMSGIETSGPIYKISADTFTPFGHNARTWFFLGQGDPVLQDFVLRLARHKGKKRLGWEGYQTAAYLFDFSQDYSATQN